jgi:hypothetical protein
LPFAKNVITERKVDGLKIQKNGKNIKAKERILKKN